MHCHGHSPICHIWACPWTKNMSNLAQIGSRLCGMQISETVPWEKNCHGELTVSSRWSRLRGPMITAQSRLGLVTAQSRRGHSSVTVRSQLSHGEVTAQSQRSRLSHGYVTAQSRPRSRLSHGWLWPFWSQCAHREFTVSSPWAVTVANFFLMEFDGFSPFKVLWTCLDL